MGHISFTEPNVSMCSVRPSQVVSTHHGLEAGLDAGPVPNGHYPGARGHRHCQAGFPRRPLPSRLCPTATDPSHYLAPLPTGRYRPRLSGSHRVSFLSDPLRSRSHCWPCRTPAGEGGCGVSLARPGLLCSQRARPCATGLPATHHPASGHAPWSFRPRAPALPAPAVWRVTRTGSSRCAQAEAE